MQRPSCLTLGVHGLGLNARAQRGPPHALEHPEKTRQRTQWHVFAHLSAPHGRPELSAKTRNRAPLG
eukprot:3735199-Lingulodinium_polyedra.AAC.1